MMSNNNHFRIANLHFTGSAVVRTIFSKKMIAQGTRNLQAPRFFVITEIQRPSFRKSSVSLFFKNYYNYFKYLQLLLLLLLPFFLFFSSSLLPKKRKLEVKM